MQILGWNAKGCPDCPVLKLARIFPNAPIVATLGFGDIQTLSFSRFLERQTRLSVKKAFSSLELSFFRL